MEKMQEFALKFRRQASLPPLSPLPVLRANPASPCRKVSESHSLYIRYLKETPTQRKFKLVKRRELTPPVAMKFFHILKWVSIGSKSTNTKNINKTSNIFVNCTENIEIVQHIG